MRTYPIAWPRPSHRQRGFTLMELMVVLTVSAIILGFAVPNFRDFLRNNRLAGDSNDLLSTLAFARTEAIKRQIPIVVCATTDTEAALPTCSGSWAKGSSSAWIAFADINNNWKPDAAEMPVLAKHKKLDDSVAMVSDQSGRVKYLATGFASSATGGFSNSTAIALCDERGRKAIGTQYTARAILISPTGRTRITRIQSEVDAVPNINTVCPKS